MFNNPEAVRQQHDLEQGFAEWIGFRRSHYGASEIAAVLGLSRNTKRSELLHLKSTGMEKEFSDYVQKKILDKGHEIEAIARPIAEKLMDDTLYPVVWSYGRLSASCDGLNMTETAGWENKQFNQEYFELVESGQVPEEHMPQIQQCLLVTGAERWLFTVSDGTEDGTASIWVYPDEAWFERITLAWAQFHEDLATYQPCAVQQLPEAEVVIALPTLFVHAKGEITTHNMTDYGTALTEQLEIARSIVLVSDQDFANAKAAAKTFREQIKTLAVCKEAMLSQTVTIGEAARMIDAWSEDLRVTALQLEKNVEKEDQAKKVAMINEAKNGFNEHIAALEKTITPIRLGLVVPDFAGAIKGKRNYVSMHDAINTLLANAKVEAESATNDIRAKLDWCKAHADGYGFLFNDLQQIIIKPMDDFQLLVSTRVKDHKAEEERKTEEAAEAAREKIRKEEREKLEQQQRDEQAQKDREAQEAADKAKAEAQPEVQPEAQPETLKLGGGMVEIDSRPERSTVEAVSFDAGATTVGDGVNALMDMLADVGQQPMQARAGVEVSRPLDSMEEMVSLPRSEYDAMLKRLHWLDCLEQAGVDNWSGIDEAIAIRKQYSELV